MIVGHSLLLTNLITSLLVLYQQSTYFESLDSTVSRLKPILSKIAVKNTIVVMVCNFGQSALLVNFVCAAKAKGYDISNVLLFATDEETLKLGKGLGLATFYDEAVSGKIYFYCSFSDTGSQSYHSICLRLYRIFLHFHQKKQIVMVTELL